MSSHMTRIEPELEQIDCFQCEEGCIHFEFGYTLMSFSKDTFLHIAELFDEVKKSVQNEEKLDEWSEEILTEEEI